MEPRAWLLLEYDDERSGSFDALAAVPEHTTVVLGLVTTKTGRVETVDELADRIREASRFVPLERLAALAPMRVRDIDPRQPDHAGAGTFEASGDRGDRRDGVGVIVPMTQTGRMHLWLLRHAKSVP